MEISTESSEASDVGVSSSSDWSTQRCSSFKGSENFGSDSVFYEKFLLEDLDSYMEDINVRLTISRMVSDSIIKGMVNAVSEEAAEKIALKEAEVAFLNEKLRFFESVAGGDGEILLASPAHETERLEFEIQPGCLDSHNDRECHVKEQLGNLKIAAEEQFHRLAEEIREISVVSRMDSGGKKQSNISDKWVKMGRNLSTLKNIFRLVYEQIDNAVFFPKASLYEQKWEHEFQEEIEGVVFQCYVRNLREDFEEKLKEQRNYLLDIQKKKWMMKIDGLTGLREDLDIISRSLFGPEPGKLLSHGSHEGIEEWTSTERKDWIHRKVSGNHISPSISIREENGCAASEKSNKSSNSTPEIIESLQLKHMSKEDLISYFNAEITKMKRNHESVVQEITEEYFSFRREFLKEKGSSHLRKDKDFDTLRKKIPEVILKLDDILVENEKLPTAWDDYESICSLKDRINNLVLENQRLRDILTDNRKEIKRLSSQVSHATDKMSHHSRAETNFLKRITKLKCDMEDLKIDAFIQEEIYKILLKELTEKAQHSVDDADIQAIIMHDICATIFREAVKDATATFDVTMMEYNKEKQRITHLEAILMEKEKALHSEIEGKEKLKQELEAVKSSMEKLSSETSFALMTQKENCELVCQELHRVTDQANHQERLISENNKKLDLVKSRLEEAMEQIRLYKVKVGELDKKIQAALDELREAEREKSILNIVIQEKESAILSAIENEQEQRKQMEFVLISVHEISKVMDDFECRVAENFVRNSARLEMLNDQCRPLVQQANLLKRKGLVYKQALERRCSDLQKAEAEVDLLGDEVEALQSLLEKIYIALDHYSPIMRHYTGVMEILELVRRELKEERNNKTI